MAKSISSNLENRKSQISDIKNNIESKKGDLDDLRQQKSALLEAGSEIQGSGLDDRIMNVLMDSINQSLESVEDQGRTLSAEMNADAQKLEQIREENDSEIETAASEKQMLENKKALLDRFGLGGALEQGISELVEHSASLDKIKSETIQAMQEVDKIASQLDGL